MDKSFHQNLVEKAFPEHTVKWVDEELTDGKFKFGIRYSEGDVVYVDYRAVPYRIDFENNVICYMASVKDIQSISKSK